MNTATKARFTYNDIYETIREYHWMIRELERLKNTQPGDSPVTYETKRRRQKRERAERFEERLHFIDEHLRCFQEEERAILDCLLEGMQLTEISAHMQMHRKRIAKVRDDIVTRLFETQHEGESK